MKLIHLLLLGVLFLASCSDDDENSIIGTWSLSTGTLSDCDDPEENQTITAGGDCTVFCLEETITLREDGTFTTVTRIAGFGSDDTETVEGTYTIEGDQLTSCADGDCISGMYEVNGDRLILTRNDADSGCTEVSNYNRG